MSVQESLTRGVIHALGSAPERFQRLLAGRPIEIDGQRLTTEVQMALRLLGALPGASFEDLPLDRARAQIDSEARIFGARIEVASVEDILIPGSEREIPARVYRAHPDRPCAGTVVYFHGGGWVVGSLESGDSVCRFIAARSGLRVIAVDYRLAPEAPFPAGLTDAVDAFRWVRDVVPDAEDVEPWIAVAGDSAGGNLAAVTCLETRSDPSGGPDYQLLFFPVTDLARKHRSYELFAEGYFLTEKQMDWYRGHYLGAHGDAEDPRVSPLYAHELSGLPPAHVAVSGFDVLRDEGLAYADRLEAAGVPTTRQLEAGHIHAFVNATGVGKTSGIALARAVDTLVAALPDPARAAVSD
ncbi:alpha/beta hydrolase [Mycetocola tolaasinivorans]|nr:alpha/beta hydrolase [Mycetocola tolaasinivorans]